MIVIDHPNTDQTCDIRQIMQECFHDPDSWFDLFFRRRYRPENTLLALLDGVSAGILMLLPAKLKKPGLEKKSLLYYAGAVLPQFRGAGVFGRLMDKAQMIAKEESAALMVMPHEPEWLRYYAPRGFSECFSTREYRFNVQAETDKIQRFEELSAEEFYSLREEYFSERSFVSWDLEACAFALEEHCFCGGFALKTCQNGQNYAIIGEVKQDTLHIKETTLPEEQLRSVLSELAREKDCGQVKVSLPCDQSLGELKNAGLGRGMEEFAPCWLNFVLN